MSATHPPQGVLVILGHSLVSAGFDAAEGDDLGECNVTPTGYAHMTAMLCTLAEGRVIAALEVSSINYEATGDELNSTGRLQPRLHRQLFSRRGRDTPWAAPSAYQLPVRLGIWYGNGLSCSSRAVRFLEIH